MTRSGGSAVMRGPAAPADRFGAPRSAGGRPRSRPCSVGISSNRSEYDRPVAVLVGRWTGSMGEGVTIGLDAMERDHHRNPDGRPSRRHLRHQASAHRLRGAWPCGAAPTCPGNAARAVRTDRVCAARAPGDRCRAPGCAPAPATLIERIGAMADFRVRRARRFRPVPGPMTWHARPRCDRIPGRAALELLPLIDPCRPASQPSSPVPPGPRERRDSQFRSAGCHEPEKEGFGDCRPHRGGQ